jgi:predicted nucleic acid-binding protein
VIVPENAWVFDTGPLRHFAAQGWLGVLRFISGEHPVYIPDSVERELDDAAERVSAVRGVLEADWISVYRSFNQEYVEAFAHYRDRLVVNGKNLGECGVLAMGQVYKCEVVIDDSTARQIAKEKGIRALATVPLLCEAIREKKLTTVMVEELADSLLQGDGGFRRWKHPL